MKYNIAISGSYGGMNLGDEAILEGILQELKNKDDFNITVFSVNAKDTMKRHGVRAVPIREMHKDEVFEELQKVDLFVLGGGGLLFDGCVEIFLRDLTWAQELNIPTMIYAISVGPLNKAESKQLVVQVLNKTDIITVRESESKRILHDLGVTKEIEVTADPALLLKPQPFTKEMLKNEGFGNEENMTIIGFSVREPGPAAPDLNIDQYHTILANTADFMVERYNAHVLFIPFERGPNRDLQHSHAVIAKMLNAQNAHVLKGEYLSGQILGLMKYMSFAVGMRIHFLIFGSLQNVPFLSLPYAAKVKGFLEDLGMPYHPMERWNSGQLCAVLDRAWDNQKTMKKNLEEKIPLLQAKAKTSNQILREFLKKIKK